MREGATSAVELVVDERIAPSHCVALQRFLLREVAGGRRPPTLYLYELDQDCVALGRFRFAAGGLSLHRRLAGGAVVPLGPGFLGAALILPRRDELCASPPGELSAAQVMNRHVRALLQGCRLAGVDPLYPGRDVVTVDGRNLAALSLLQETDGSALFEVVVAVSRGFNVLPGVLDAVDPGGAMVVPMRAAETETTLARALGRQIGFDEAAAIYLRGFEAHTGTAPSPAAHPAAGALATGQGELRRWVDEPSVAAFSHYGTTWAQLGLVEVAFDDDAGRLRDVRIGGDVIASPAALRRLERQLRGLAGDSEEIDRVVASACRARDDYILGLGSPAVVRQAIAAARSS